MTLLCYNKGCGQTFDADTNNDGEMLLLFCDIDIKD